MEVLAVEDTDIEPSITALEGDAQSLVERGGVARWNAGAKSAVRSTVSPWPPKALAMSA